MFIIARPGTHFQFGWKIGFSLLRFHLDGDISSYMGALSLTRRPEMLITKCIYAIWKRILLAITNGPGM